MLKLFGVYAGIFFEESKLLPTGRRIAHGGGSFLEEAFALIIWFLDF